MQGLAEIDVAFDARSDAGARPDGTARDPDRYSRTLRRYHQLLWSKPLPSGGALDLRVGTEGDYLVDDSRPERVFLGSDCIVHSLAGYREMQGLAGPETRDLIEQLQTTGWTVGGSTLFPSNRVDGRMTINGERGTRRQIRDRFDLTLECIRLHYSATAPTPLSSVLDRYDSFFRLFGDFTGYVRFFLLDDLVDDRETVRFWAPFRGFEASPLPSTREAYATYLRALSHFVAARNSRVADFVCSASA